MEVRRRLLLLMITVLLGVSTMALKPLFAANTGSSLPSVAPFETPARVQNSYLSQAGSTAFKKDQPSSAISSIIGHAQTLPLLLLSLPFVSINPLSFSHGASLAITKVSKKVIDTSVKKQMPGRIWTFFHSRKTVSRLFAKIKFRSLARLAGISFVASAIAGLASGDGPAEFIFNASVSTLWLTMNDALATAIVKSQIMRKIIPKNLTAKTLTSVFRKLSIVGIAVSTALDLFTSESIMDKLTNPGFYVNIGLGVLPIVAASLPSGPFSVIVGVGAAIGSVVYNVVDTILSVSGKNKNIQYYQEAMLNSSKQEALLSSMAY